MCGFCAVGGVEPQSETVWRQANKYDVPRIAFVNKMDRIGADFSRVVSQIRNRLGGNPVCIQMPIGSESQFIGLIDLIEMRAFYWDVDDLGVEVRESGVPADLQNQALQMREALVEVVAESCEELMDKYLNGYSLTSEEIKNALRQLVLANKVVPVLCGSAFKNKGIQSLLDAVIDYLPSPLDKKPVVGLDEEKGGDVVRYASDDQPFAAAALRLLTCWQQKKLFACSVPENRL